MDWYHVIKTINGQRYVYRQITWREEGRVRTRSVYVGRAEVPRAKKQENSDHGLEGRASRNPDKSRETSKGPTRPRGTS